ncbi:MAG: hypothetical protein ACU84Q_12470 [Gammaproteobacteria bacterium]
MTRNNKNYLPRVVIDAQAICIKLSLLITCLLASNANHATSLASGRYEIKSTTVMPHLEEMRRNVKTEVVCVTKTNVVSLFPVLRYAAFEGCSAKHIASELPAKYKLVCPGPNGAIGSITLKLNGPKIKGVLESKMGGKNMTFSQFVEASRVGDCAN